MATPKKKHLIELMIEAGVKWPDGAEYAAQDKDDKKLHFYSDGIPNLKPATEFWAAYNCDHHVNEAVHLEVVCRNWHQTIVTREQYEDALAAVTPDVQHEARESECTPAVDAVEWHNPPTIEQLTADYHAKAAEVDRLQADADEALKAADDALLALEKAGELIGLVISIDTKPKRAEQPEITDWLDLRVGDVIKVFGEYWNDEEEYEVEINDGSDMPIQVGGYWVRPGKDEFTFIRRP